MTVVDPEVRNYFFRERCAMVFLEPSRTKQSMKDACDVKAIVRRYQSTGVLEHAMKSEPTYGDFTSVGDYLGAWNRVQAAQQQFSELPAELRDKCGNDPAEFVAFLHDAENAEELRELGLEKLVDALHGPEVGLPVEPEPKGDPAPVGAPPAVVDQISLDVSGPSDTRKVVT